MDSLIHTRFPCWNAESIAGLAGEDADVGAQGARQPQPAGLPTTGLSAILLAYPETVPATTSSRRCGKYATFSNNVVPLLSL